MDSAQSKDSENGISFVWNALPSNRQDMTKIVIPVGFHYTPAQKNENMPLLEYDPLTCKNCKSVISPVFSYSIRAKNWDCPFCNSKITFPKAYSDYITEENLPAELLQENTTVEYKLSTKESNFPTFIFLIDTAVDEEELNELKESIQQIVNSLPQECYVGIISFGRMCNVHEIGNTDIPICYAWNGEKAYQPNEIQELLGWNNKSSQPKFIMPVGEIAFSLNSFLDDLQPDSWGKKAGERNPNCVGLALNTAISLVESICKNDPARILMFMGGPGTIGEGAIVSKDLKETIRNFVDFEKGNTNTNYYKKTVEFYNKAALRASRIGIIIDIFSCCLNQVGLYEMKNLIAKTGGYMIFTDSFSTMIFKDSLKKIFDIDENGNWKMCFKGKLDFNCTSNIKISGAIGHLASVEQKSAIVSDIPIGEGNTKTWLLGGLDANSTYTFILDCHNATGTVEHVKPNKRCVIQWWTTYIAGDRSTRMRVCTIEKKSSQIFPSRTQLKKLETRLIKNLQQCE